MILLDNETDYNISPETQDDFLDIANRLTDRDVELIICNDKKITEINLEHRGKNASTDVLSFPLEGDYKHMPLGTIVISLDKAKTASEAYMHTVDNEMMLLFIHGLLHLLGYDHESDDGEMREMEHDLIERFGLPDSLIIRTEKK